MWIHPNCEKAPTLTCLSRGGENWQTLLAAAHVVHGEHAELVLGVRAAISKIH